jgi:NDP-sugar pyrophosphorylase family protein
MERNVATHAASAWSAIASEPEHELAATSAVILAGGLGTRLRSVVADRPKVLAEVAGVPFVFHLLTQLASAGVKHAVLATGHLGEQVRDALGTAYGPLELEYAHEPAPLGTGGAIRHALPLVRSHALFVLNGDSYCDVELAHLWLWHHQRAAHGTLALTRVPDARRFGTVTTDDFGRVLSFVEKSNVRRRGTVNAGLYLLRRSLVASIPSGVACSLEHDLLPRWLDDGIYGYARCARFIDIGTPASFAAAERFFRPAAAGRARASRRSSGAQRTPLSITAEVA